MAAGHPWLLARGGHAAVAVCAPRSCSAGEAGFTSGLGQGASGGCASGGGGRLNSPWRGQ